MSWKPIIAGVDASPSGAWAGATAFRLAERTGAECRLVHVVKEHWSPDAELPVPLGDFTYLRARREGEARDELVQALEGNVPPVAIEHLDIQFGNPARVLREVAIATEADLVVVGATHHGRLARWLMGSNARDIVRLADTPVLVATESTTTIERVMAAVDLSAAAQPTIDMAERFAALHGAALNVVHVMPVTPLGGDVGPDPHAEAQRAAVDEALSRVVWPFLSRRDAEREVLYGPAVPILAREVRRWGADILVLGSHGRGFVDRILLGSVTNGLLSRMPTSILVVPAPHARPAARVDAEIAVAAINHAG